MIPAPDCALDDVLRALADDTLPAWEHVRTAPPELTGSGSRSATGKAILGQRMANHLDSENFTVAWRDGDATEATAERASIALERSWDALVLDLGWQAPVSSDRYLLWVILDPDLPGTGLTTVYDSDDVEAPYPVVFLNPAYAGNVRFFDSLAAHEFNHMLQFALRDWNVGDEDAWYWEASAEWGAELALPEVDAYAEQTDFYAAHPEYRYSSMDDYHSYGMLLVNAWLEEHGPGPGTMLAVWEEGIGREQDDWDDILADATGLPAEEIWAEMAATIAQRDFVDGAQYAPPTQSGTVEDGLSASVDYLGTRYFRVEQDAEVEVSGDALLSTPAGWGDAVSVQSGELLAVTGLRDSGAAFTLLVDVEGDPPGNTENPFSEDPAVACGCASASSGGFAWLLALGVLVRRR